MRKEWKQGGWEALKIVKVRDDSVLDGGRKCGDREKWMNLVYILEVQLTGVAVQLAVDRET